MRPTKAAGAVIGAALWTISCGSSAPSGAVSHEHHVTEPGAATRVRVAIDMSAGELEMKSGASTLFEGDFDFNVPALKPSIAYAVDGGTGTLKVSQGSTSGNYENSWRLNLGEMLPVALRVKLGAGDANLELGRLNLDSLEIELGAGDLMLDLRGMPARSYRVMVQAGAGDTTIHLPATVGISAQTSGIIGDVSVKGLEMRDGRWVNTRAQASAVTVNLDVQHAIGDLKLLAE